MTRKDYELIANVFARRIERIVTAKAPKWQVRQLANEMADALQQDNKAFDRDRFLKACGIL